MINRDEKTKMDNKRNASFVICVGKIILSFLLLCLFSVGNSPFAIGCYGYDVSYYNVIGRMINAGRIPYRDFFDVKGPVFLYWQALGQKVSTDRWGAFILECFLMMVCVVLLHLIGEAVHIGHFYNMVLFVVYQYVFIKSFWGSCSVEEFTMPGNLFSLYFALKMICNKKTGFNRACCKPVHFFVMGLFFGMALFSKITTAAPMCVSLVFILVVFFMDKNFKQMLHGILLYIMGITIVTIIIMAYYIYIHNLKNMLTWTFVKAVSRGINKDMGGGGIILRSVLIIFFVAYALIKIHKKKADLMDWFLLVISMAAFIMLQIGERWSYYYLQLLPMIVLFMIVFFENLREVREDGFILLEYADKKERVGYLLMSLVCVVVCIFSFGGNLSENTSESFDSVFKQKHAHMDADFEKITSMIPPQERGKVFCLEKGIRYFESSGIVPANMFPGFVTTFTYLDDKVTEKRLSEMNSVKPLWIVSMDVENNEMDVIINILKQDYSLALQDDMGYELWKRK